ncbi:MAG: hypothetical protein AAF791_04925 [Bacteroidota bacterium]
MPHLRLDRVATKPGAVGHARTYSLVLHPSALYVLDVGPAAQPDDRPRRLSRWLSEHMIVKARTRTDPEPEISDEVRARLAELDALGPEALAQTPGSFCFGANDVTVCEAKRGEDGAPALRIDTSTHSFVFVTPPDEEAYTHVFSTAVRSWAGVR